MNFSYLENKSEFASIYTACREAEEFAPVKPDISAASARKAMELIVKYIYSGIDSHPPYGFTVHDMINDSRFRGQFADPALLNSIDFIRRQGNSAVHRGSLTVDQAMAVLRELHFLTGEFAVTLGFTDEYPEFTAPKPKRIGEAISRIHADNFDLKLLPYLQAEGLNAWVEILKKQHKETISELFDLPEELNCDRFFEFLRQFERSIPDEVNQLLELLPLSYATEREWAERRENLPEQAIRRIECYVEASMQPTDKMHMLRWTPYMQVLETKALAYMYLVHPDMPLKSMLAEVILPDSAVKAPEDEFIPIEEAIKMLFRHIASQDLSVIRKLTMETWCRNQMGMSLHPLRLGKTISKGNADQVAMFGNDRIELGGRRYYYRTVWDKQSLFAVRSLAGEFGEQLITMDRMADWGFAPAGSEADKRATERAERRKAAEEAKKAVEAEKAAKQLEKAKAVKPAKAVSDPEASPRAIREYLGTQITLPDWFSSLTSEEWCAEQLGLKHPVLVDQEEGVYRNRKQMNGITLYSPIRMEFDRKEYMILRMKESEFRRLQEMIGRGHSVK